MLLLPVRNRGINRTMSVAFLLVGAVALYFFISGPQPSREPDSLWDAFRAAGYSVVERSAPSNPYFEEDYAEIEGKLSSADVNGQYVILRQMPDVPRAMSFYRSSVAAPNPGFRELLDADRPPTRWFRNQNFVLEIPAAEAESAEEIGEFFERW